MIPHVREFILLLNGTSRTGSLLRVFTILRTIYRPVGSAVANKESGHELPATGCTHHAADHTTVPDKDPIGR